VALATLAYRGTGKTLLLSSVSAIKTQQGSNSIQCNVAFDPVRSGSGSKLGARVLTWKSLKAMARVPPDEDDIGREMNGFFI
jgi:hypothetical protein